MEKWLHNNTVMRIVAVLLAILLWVVVHLDEQGTITPSASQIHTRTISEVQVTTVGLNKELLSIQAIDPEYVTLVLKGNESTVNAVRPNAGEGLNQIQLDLSGIHEPGQHAVALQSIGFPEEIEVTIYPPTVNVTVEEIASKEVPIHIELKGEPAEGYIADIPIINPIRAVVDVPDSILQQITAAKAIVDISDATSAVEVTSRLFAIDESGNEIDAVISPAVVHVIVPITSPFKTVPIQVKLINEPAEGYSVASMKLSETEITLYGPEAVLDMIDIYQLVEIDLTELKNTQRLNIVLPLIEGIHEIKPAAITVELVVVPSITKVLEQVPITISGANQNYMTTIIDPETGALDVVVEGAASVLETVTLDNVQAIVDVSNQPQGVHELPVKLNLPNNVAYGDDEPLIVTVAIEPLEEEEE